MSHTVRVELRHASADAYDDLYAAMEEQGFRRFITSDDDIEYELPTAELLLARDRSRKYVLSAAKKAAKTTGLEHEILRR